MKGKELFAKVLFLVSALVSVVGVLLVCIFLFSSMAPVLREVGFLPFVFGKTWQPGSGAYGILPMVLGSFLVTAGSVVLGVPVGVLAAVYLAKFCPQKVYRLVHPAVELMAGIPSVVYGFFGLMVLVPASSFLFGGSGKNAFLASVLLATMILPTIITVSETAVRSVDESLFLGALALGDTEVSAVFRVIVPAARSGIVSSVILGVGRSIGETMAVIMVAGNQAVIPKGLFRGVRTMTANIVLEMGYAADLHRNALIATGVVLFVFILAINLLFSFFRKESAK